MISVVSITGLRWQTERNAIYQPYRFTTQDGDSLYLVNTRYISSWSDRYLIVKDSYDHVVYFLDTTSMIARRAVIKSKYLCLEKHCY